MENNQHMQSEQANSQPGGQNKMYSKKSIVIAVIITVLVMAIIGVTIYCISLNKKLKEADTAAVTASTQTTAAPQASDTTTVAETTTAAPVTTKAPLKGITGDELKNYNVAFSDGGGVQVLVMNYECNDDCDGYLIKVVYGYKETWEHSYYKVVNANCKRVYLGTQQGEPWVFIRSYRKSADSSQKEYSPWWTLCNWKLAKLSGETHLMDPDWDSFTAGAVCIDE